MKGISKTIVVTIIVVIGVLFSIEFGYSITLAGNYVGNPAYVSKDPCPTHGDPYQCKSALLPSTLSLLTDTSTWFRGVLETEYTMAAGWNFHYMGSNPNMKGKFDVDKYLAYNECPGLLGAEIKMSFVPDADSFIKDVLWIQAYRERWPSVDNSAMDDRDRLPASKQPGTLFGPFYPYQDEDEEIYPGAWQTNYQFDYFYDKPGDPCPQPNTETRVEFEVYACWWDDVFNNDGTIVDIGNDGHHVYIHEGVKWGYTLSCVPEPGTFVLLVFGLGCLCPVVLKRRRHG